MVDKFRSKIAEGKNSMLFKGGQLSLFSSLFNALPFYLVSSKSSPSYY